MCILEVAEISADGASVTLEDHTDANRRCDMLIEVGNKKFPIEVKINAGDQEHQLYDYYHYYFGENENSTGKIYYLTPDGRDPSSNSIENNTGEKLDSGSVVNISGKQIMKWLSEVFYDDPFRKSLKKQFMEVIESMSKDADNLYQLEKELNIKDSFKEENISTTF